MFNFILRIICKKWQPSTGKTFPGNVLAFFSADIALFTWESNVNVALISPCVLPLSTITAQTGVVIFHPLRLRLSINRSTSELFDTAQLNNIVCLQTTLPWFWQVRNPHLLNSNMPDCSSIIIIQNIWTDDFSGIFIASACSRVRYRRPIFLSVRPSVCQHLCRCSTFMSKLVFLSHLLVAGCDIGVRFSVRPSVRQSVRPSVCQHLCRCSTFMSKLVF